jgi:hypothetical protein
MVTALDLRSWTPKYISRTSPGDESRRVTSLRSQSANA